VSVEAAELEEADTVICVGTGVGGAESLPVIEALAEVCGGRIGATRRVVDQGWMPRHFQIGLIVSPRLYIGIGVRGALNHTIGIQQAGAIVAINNDAGAEIIQTADFALVGDWAELVPALTESIRRSLKR
jgi:electron transfer flavoprotein alpha subunit